MTENFSGMTVVITGASAGVGAACARAFAAQNAKLVLVARGRAGLNKIAKELREQCEVLIQVMDVKASAVHIMEFIHKNKKVVPWQSCTFPLDA